MQTPSTILVNSSKVRKGCVYPVINQSDSELIDTALEATEGMTQIEAAEALDMSQRTISNWRRGERGAIQEKTRRTLMRRLEQMGALADGTAEAPLPTLDQGALDLIAGLFEAMAHQIRDYARGDLTRRPEGVSPEQWNAMEKAGQEALDRKQEDAPPKRRASGDE